MPSKKINRTINKQINKTIVLKNGPYKSYFTIKTSRSPIRHSVNRWAGVGGRQGEGASESASELVNLIIWIDNYYLQGIKSLYT